MSTRRSPARLVIALSIAAVLAVFLLYTSFSSGASPSIRPSQLAEYDGTVSLAGTVLGPITGNAREEGLRFTLRDIDGTATVAVLYSGSVPELFEIGRHVFMSGQLEDGVFVAKPDSLVTKCPSKYAPKQDTADT